MSSSSEEKPPIPASSRLTQLAAGDKFAGRYRLVSQLGQGGMGVVWQAIDETLDLEVALKFLHEVLAHDEDALHDLKRETRRALQLTHPHIVRVHSLVEDVERGLTGIAMEYVPGESLTRRRLKQPNRYFTPEQVAPWLVQLCEALTYAHEKAGIIHRDLKPANILLDARDEVRITDFGISATASDSITRLTRASDNSGTLAYMSPQQAEGRKPVATDDLYALGASLYELLTGKPPFYMGSILAQLVGRVPPPVAQRREEIHGTAVPIPELWEQVIASLLAKDPAARPQSARDVCSLLGIGSPSTGAQYAIPAVRADAPPIPELPTARATPLPIPAAPPLPRTSGTAAGAPPPIPSQSPVTTSMRPSAPPWLTWAAIALAVSVAGIALGIVLVKFTEKKATSASTRSAASANPSGASTTSPVSPVSAHTQTSDAPGRVRPAGEWQVPLDRPTIAAAVAAAQPGETVVVSPGTYAESIVLKSGIHLRGTDPALCRLGPAPGASCVIQASDARDIAIENLTIEADTKDQPPLYDLGWKLEDREGEVIVLSIEPGGPAALAGIRSGDTVSVIDGVAITTTEAVAALASREIPPRPLKLQCTTAGAPRVIEAVPRLASTPGGWRDGVVLVGCTSRLHGCIVRGFGGSGVVVEGTSSAALIEDCTITGNGRRGIFARGGSLQIANTRCTGNRAAGLLAEDIPQGFLLSGSAFSGCERGSGVSLRSVAGIVRDCIAEENSAAGISIVDTASNVTIEGGRFRRNEAHGVYFGRQAHGVLDGVTCDGNKGSGLAVVETGTVVSSPAGKNQFAGNIRGSTWASQGGVIKQ